MEQRPLRLGDTVDDYCPRERRVTNHVIVAIVGDAIRQTRCSTCDAEHVFKAAKPPRRRKKDGELYEEVLADVTGSQLAPPKPVEPPAPALNARADTEPSPIATAEASTAEPVESSPEPGETRPDDHWPAHRQLIRASLPRSESDPPPIRPIPEFTMHQRPFSRGHGGRHGQGWSGNGFGNGDANGNGNGHGFGGHGRQPGQGRSGQGQPGGQFRRPRGGKHRRPR